MFLSLDYLKQLVRWGNLLILIILLIVSSCITLALSIRNTSFSNIADVIILLLSALVVMGIYRVGFNRIVGPRAFQIVLLVGLVLRLLVLWHDIYDRPTPDSDYAKYEKLGERLAFEHRYYDFTLATGLELRAYRPPGLPFMMALAYLVIGRDKAPLVLMTTLGFGVIIASYFLLKPANTVLAAILFGYIAISPNVLFMASISSTQLPFWLIFLLLFIVMQRYQGRWWQCVLIGCLLAAGALTRLNMFLVVPCVLLFLWEKHQGAMVTASSRFALIVLVMASIIAPWTYRNYRETGGFIPVSITSGASMYTANVITDPKRGGGYSGIHPEFFERFRHLNEADLEAAMKRAAIIHIKEHPIIYLKSIPFRIAKYMSPQQWTIRYFNSHSKVTFGLEFLMLEWERLLIFIVYMLGLASLWYTKKLNALPTFILLSYLSYTLLDVGLFESGDRYHFPYILFPLFGMSLNRVIADIGQVS